MLLAASPPLRRREQFLELHKPWDAAIGVLKVLEANTEPASLAQRTVASPEPAIVWGPPQLVTAVIPAWAAADPVPQGAKARPEKAALGKAAGKR